MADALDQAASPDVSTVPFGSLAKEFICLTREVYRCCATEPVTNTNEDEGACGRNDDFPLPDKLSHCFWLLLCVHWHE